MKRRNELYWHVTASLSVLNRNQLKVCINVRLKIAYLCAPVNRGFTCIRLETFWINIWAAHWLYIEGSAGHSYCNIYFKLLICFSRYQLFYNIYVLMNDWGLSAYLAVKIFNKDCQFVYLCDLLNSDADFMPLLINMYISWRDTVSQKCNFAWLHSTNDTICWLLCSLYGAALRLFSRSLYMIMQPCVLYLRLCCLVILFCNLHWCQIIFFQSSS